jgi:hypothetical protein
VFNLSSGGGYEIEMFVRPTAASAGNIFEIRDGGGPLLTLALDSSKKVTLVSDAFGLDEISSSLLTLNAFQHVLLRLSGGTASVYVGGALFISATMTADVTLDATAARLGGFTGQIDEFLFRHSAGTGNPAVPQEPHRGTLKVSAVGGFGDGSFGNVTISAQNTQINTYAMINSVDSGTGKITIGAQSEGVYGAFAAGQELMIHVSHYKSASKELLGRWFFRRIAAIDGSEVTLDRPLSDDMQITHSTVDLYWIQALSVPNFENLTVTSAGVIVPLAWGETSGGGIVAFRCTDHLVLSNGKILTAGKGVHNQDHGLNLSHTEILERFINNGNVFIAARYVDGAPGARIGNEGDGSLGGGVGGLGGRDKRHPGTEIPGGEAGVVKAGGKGSRNERDDGHPGHADGGNSNMGGGCPSDSYAVCSPGGDKEFDPPNVIIVAGTLILDRSVISVGGYGGGGGGGGGYGGSSGRTYGGGGGAAGGGGSGGIGADGPHQDGGDGGAGGGDGTGGGAAGEAGEGEYGGGGGGSGGGSGYGGGGGGGGHAAGGGGGGGSDTGFAYIAAEVLTAA